MSYNPSLITPFGKYALGKLLKVCRENSGWSIEDLVVKVCEVTGHEMSKSTISQIERGVPDPTWNTLSLLAAVRYILHPRTGEPLTTYDLFRIACEEEPITLPARDSKRSKFPTSLQAAENYSDYKVEFAG